MGCARKNSRIEMGEIGKGEQPMKLTKEDVLHFLERVIEEIEKNKDFLTELDSAIGDGDHGINMDRGFKKVRDSMKTLKDKDIGAILKSVGMMLVSTVGGASGPLYGTAFMKAGGELSGKTEANEQEILKALKSALEGIKMRGKATEGEKTMIDTIAPFVSTLEKHIQSEEPEKAFERALESAEKGMKATIPMKATKGRASYLGERSIGHQDPGATSSFIILKQLVDVVRG